LPLTPNQIEEILASDKAGALIEAVSRNEEEYTRLAGQGYAKLTMVDSCVKRPVSTKSATLSALLYWDEAKSGFFPKDIYLQSNPTTKFTLEYALPLNSGGRLPRSTTFEFELVITRIANPSKDFKLFTLEAYPYWIRDFYNLRIPSGAFLVYPKNGSAGSIILTPQSNSIRVELCPA